MSTNSHDPFILLLQLYKEADALCNTQLKADEANARIWTLLRQKLNGIKVFLDNKTIPSLADKAKLEFGVMLARNFDLPEDSHKLASLFKLNNQFQRLGEKELSDEELLRMYNILTIDK